MACALNGSEQPIGTNSLWNYTFFISVKISTAISHLHVEVSSIVSQTVNLVIQSWNHLRWCHRLCVLISRWIQLLNELVLKSAHNWCDIQYYHQASALLPNKLNSEMCPTKEYSFLIWSSLFWRATHIYFWLKSIINGLLVRPIHLLSYLQYYHEISTWFPSKLPC
jgi:hypothetical protein